MKKVSKETKVNKNEEWIWVEGYKGTDANMCCRGYQYELGKQFDMPEGDKVELCEGGFHLCPSLKDVFEYYRIGDGHRFFKVKALVRKEEFEDATGTPAARSSSSDYMTWLHAMMFRGNKLTSKSIEFVSECTMDEIFSAYKKGKFNSWSKKDKKLALEKGIRHVENMRIEKENKKKVKALVDLGYSEVFSGYVIKKGHFDVAYAVGSQQGLSMDMKVLMIFEN